MKILKTLCLGIIFVVLIIEGIWLIAIPEEFIKEKLMNIIPADIKIEELRKDPFFGIYIKSLSISISEMSTAITDLHVSPSWHSLLRGKIMVKINGKIGEGRIHGLSGNKEFIFKVEDVMLSSLRAPFLKGDGLINLTSEMKAGIGSIRLSITDARLMQIEYNRILIPLNLINTIRGNLLIKGSQIFIEPVTLSGNNLFGRLKGIVKNMEADLVLELMPEKELNNTLMLLIPQAMVSPGYFKIDIKERL